VARALKAKGIEVVAFDAANDIGGVWRENYSGFGLQSPKQLFEIPGFPWTAEKWGSIPTGEQTQAYILAFANHFKLRTVLRLGTRVEKVEKNDDGSWTLHTREGSQPTKLESFDFLVSCTGMYNQNQKFVPQIDGKEKFKGEVLHTSEFTEASIVEGKQVVVIGAGKSACDCILQAERHGASQSTLLQRKAHWAG
jgi:cation diffusion facilitator CzcD-associated flavoprotein CzcO